MKPYLFDATVAPNNMRIELTATDHGAALRVTFPATSDLGSKRVCFTNARWEGRGDIAGGTGKQASGVSSTVHQDRLSVSNFAMHIYIESPDAIEVSNEMDMTCFKYKGTPHYTPYTHFPPYTHYTHSPPYMPYTPCTQVMQKPSTFAWRLP